MGLVSVRPKSPHANCQRALLFGLIENLEQKENPFVDDRKEGGGGNKDNRKVEVLNYDKNSIFMAFYFIICYIMIYTDADHLQFTKIIFDLTSILLL